MLEHFLEFLVPPGDQLWPMAGEVLEQVIKQERRFPKQHKIKAHCLDTSRLFSRNGLNSGARKDSRSLNPGEAGKNVRQEGK